MQGIDVGARMKNQTLLLCTLLNHLEKKFVEKCFESSNTMLYFTCENIVRRNINNILSSPKDLLHLQASQSVTPRLCPVSRPISRPANFVSFYFLPYLSLYMLHIVQICLFTHILACLLPEKDIFQILRFCELFLVYLSCGFCAESSLFGKDLVVVQISQRPILLALLHASVALERCLVREMTAGHRQSDIQ